MRAILSTCLILSVVLPGFIPLTGATSTVTADVTLRVAPEGLVVPSHWTTQHEAVWLFDPAKNDALNDQDGIAGCELTVTDGNGDDAIDGGEVLDRAVATNCISGWNHQDTSIGRLVTSVDGRSQMTWPGPWWALHVDGVWSNVGIDDLDLEDGQSLDLVYFIGA